jgi:hypothetical protein
MSKPRILIQLDPDRHASVFDAVVAIDAEVDQLLQYAGVRPEEVRALVHGAMFTRGPDDLKSTAIFIGGSRVEDGEALLAEVTRTFFGPLRVSVMFDANGANTTAAAAVVAATQHRPLTDLRALVLGGTGPVGQRVARLLTGQGAQVRLGSRDRQRAERAAEVITRQLEREVPLVPCATGSAAELAHALDGVELVVAAGAAGVPLLSLAERRGATALRLAIDLNAVPPAGIEGIEATDAARDRDGVLCYGALGVGRTKMRIHKESLRRLFTDNTLVLDAEQIFDLAQSGSALRAEGRTGG